MSRKSSSRVQRDIWSDASNAVELFEKFHGKKPREVIEEDFLWPYPQTIKGVAFSCSYRSDKWMNDNHYQDYIHHHNHRPYPYVIVQAKKGDEILEDPIEPPNPPAFAVLGVTLDYEYHNLEDAKKRKKNPAIKKDFMVKRGKLVATNKLPKMIALEKQLLVIVEKDKPATLIWSPRLIVTRRGIER